MRSALYGPATSSVCSGDKRWRSARPSHRRCATKHWHASGMTGRSGAARRHVPCLVSGKGALVTGIGDPSRDSTSPQRVAAQPSTTSTPYPGAHPRPGAAQRCSDWQNAALVAKFLVATAARCCSPPGTRLAEPPGSARPPQWAGAPQPPAHPNERKMWRHHKAQTSPVKAPTRALALPSVPIVKKRSQCPRKSNTWQRNHLQHQRLNPMSTCEHLANRFRFRPAGRPVQKLDSMHHRHARS